jgi:lysophospholipase L1-like esterase
VRFVGRADFSDPIHPKFGWPGARIIAQFRGTAASVALDEQPLYTGPSRWDVLVDGARTFTLAPASGLGTYVLATGLPNATHTVELYKRTEGMVGQTRFMGFTFPNGGQLLAPPDPPARRIEFLGDSTTNGYGNECTSPLQSFSGATQNERQAFSGLVAHDLGADHHDVSYSGKGVLLNYHRADTVVFDQLFTRALPESATPLWDFTRFTPDVVWMNLGGNDWDAESPSTQPPDLDAYTAKYLALVTSVRAKYPAAHIFCSVTPSLNDSYPPGWNVLTGQRTAISTVVAARVAAGDTKIYMYEFARALPGELSGCDYHTGLPLHRKMADQVIAQIKAKTGWN